MLDIVQSNYERSEPMWTRKLSSAENKDDAKLNLAKAIHAYSEGKANVAELVGVTVWILLHIGLEDVDDLIEDLSQGVARLTKFL
ncbi:hypothetical protein [Thalassotalea sp. ND16A]|uniref:hypothetical protein n=1 Tax=Thalassotalea sp. ND16A TaxID=1535422 RepID=UPI00126A0E17|nr:hypothetical protein [Thalassotalea sp. ND16A]